MLQDGLGSFLYGCLMQLAKYTLHNHRLFSSSATRVTTQWLKQPICFCSDTVSRDYLSNLSFVLGLPVCVLFDLMFQQRGALCHVRFYVSFSPPSFAGSFAGHFENKTVPYRQPRCFTSRTRWFHINYP